MIWSHVSLGLVVQRREQDTIVIVVLLPDNPATRIPGSVR